MSTSGYSLTVRQSYSRNSSATADTNQSSFCTGITRTCYSCSQQTRGTEAHTHIARWYKLEQARGVGASFHTADASPGDTTSEETTYGACVRNLEPALFFILLQWRPTSPLTY